MRILEWFTDTILEQKDRYRDEHGTFKVAETMNSVRAREAKEQVRKLKGEK